MENPKIEDMQSGAIVGSVEPTTVDAARERMENLISSKPPTKTFEGPMTLEQVRHWIATIDHKHGREVLEEYLRLKLAPGPRTYTVRRGETLHGICKRLTGDVSPADIAERTFQMARLNKGIQAGLVTEGTVLQVPESFPLEPHMDHFSAAGRQRLEGIMFSHTEELAQSLEKLRMATDEEIARAWRNERDAVASNAELRRWLFWMTIATGVSTSAFIATVITLWAVV